MAPSAFDKVMCSLERDRFGRKWIIEAVEFVSGNQSTHNGSDPVTAHGTVK